ncbi:septum formation initiator family protein [Streptomyces sp. NPDC051907]|uniref:septum formation initiator family protein n=1 Tax=Streptomyces sp. NPDC051907 TaxID=3155284 RepID=UPI003441A28A
MSTAAKQLKGRAARLARLLPTGPGAAARTPFVLLVVLLLGGGLIMLLLLNSSLNQGSFKLSELKRQTTELTDEQQALQRDVDSYSAPGALARRARELGMVPGGSPAFLDADGKVRGVPGQASAPPAADPSPMDAQDPAAASASPSLPVSASAVSPPSPSAPASPSPQAAPAAPPAPSPAVSAQAGQAPAGPAAAAPADASAPASGSQPSLPPAKPIPTIPGR